MSERDRDRDRETDREKKRKWGQRDREREGERERRCNCLYNVLKKILYRYMGVCYLMLYTVSMKQIEDFDIVYMK